MMEREAPRVDLQPDLDRKAAALADRLALIEAQNAEELSRFPAAPVVDSTPKRGQDPEPERKSRK
jgi:hypothetical protein